MRRPPRYTHEISSHYDTYACREQLKALPNGAWFDGNLWWVTKDDYAAAMQLAVRAGPRKNRRPVRAGPAPPPKTERRCSSCGLATCPKAYDWNEPCENMGLPPGRPLSDPDCSD